MTNKPFWQAKIWGLLHDPPLKALHDNTGRGGEGDWESLDCMDGWISPKAKSLKSWEHSSQWLKHVGLCDLISSASDRAALGRVSAAVDYDRGGLEIRHLLSGAKQTLRLGEWHDSLVERGDRREWLSWVEKSLIPEEIRRCEDPRQVYWWLWRCYPVALSRALDRDGSIPNEPRLPLLPADTRIPDASVWSHTTMTSALAGGLAGYDSDYPKKGARRGKTYHESRPYLGIFSFTPVQELIKASRKMRDFWAGSWLLHYLSAKVCWAIARQYGPDTLLYPCLYAQPLIDLWLLKQYPDFKQWIDRPGDRQLLTAGFPNVLVTVLPDNGANSKNGGGIKSPVCAAMRQAELVLKQEWRTLGDRVLDDLQSGGGWMPDLNRHTWDGWLDAQWQTYWTALPVGDRHSELHQSPRKPDRYEDWQGKQNQLARPEEDLLEAAEAEFVKATYERTTQDYWTNRRQQADSYRARQPNLNVGSWWGSLFDQTRFALTAVKNPRTWTLPTAFGPRSTISGLGPVVHDGGDWVTEGDTKNDWQRQAGLFDGIEELNATEVLKRGLHRILSESELLDRDGARLQLYYPDLTSGVAGWLKRNPEAIAFYRDVCEDLGKRFEWIEDGEEPQSWGIPWIAEHHPDLPNPRRLNAGWCVEDFEPEPESPGAVLTATDRQRGKREELQRLREAIAEYFPPGNNPTDWYVLCAGDGDGMSDWLKGKHLRPYGDYIPEALSSQIDGLPKKEALKKFLECRKRMGPATHSALSRALLDFSNQLLPYLTEVRHAGRLIYGGGDDVLAYLNLWEWDDWLWDVRQCFRGDDDPAGKFDSEGDYWHWNGGELPENIHDRPLFTMGSKATISFGLVIAHHSVPLAIALEHLWEAEDAAKKHRTPKGDKKDAVQARVLYGNGNVLEATAKFGVFDRWRSLLEFSDLDAALFEQVATVWSQHPVPHRGAIEPWTFAFCDRRDAFAGDEGKRDEFGAALREFLGALWDTTPDGDRDAAVRNWLKLAAFVRRHRNIKWGGEA